ncbi:MAG: radical SAM family heme chaperone HemW [Bryobacteraceae bacterium]
MRTGVYISYPFCAQKCTYCNFASGVFPRELERDYIQALSCEIASHHWHGPADTVYLGGGTPSQMNPEALAALLRSIPGRPWREAALEAAPGTLTPDKCRAWVEAGMNRVSFGVQSFVPRELSRTGRKHTAEIVAQEVAMLRDAGISNINIDLIAGLPGQTRASWAESLEWIERLEAPHVSVYMLEIDEDSRLGQEVLLNGKRFGAPDVPGDDAIAELYETAVARLRQSGLERYEISNFARPGFESLHNLKYWRLEPYAGFGADAHSFDGVMRYQNVESASDYVERWRRSESPRLAQTATDPGEERFFVGLRLSEGVEPGGDEWDRWGAPIQRFLSDGLLETSGNRLRLTDRGVLLSNEVFAEFIA